MDYLTRKERFEAWRSTLVKPGMTTLYLDAYERYVDLPPMLREAKCHDEYYAAIPLLFEPGEQITGLFHVSEPFGFNYGVGTYIRNWGPDQGEALRKRIDPNYDLRYNLANSGIFSETEQRAVRSGVSHSQWFGGHMAIDYQRIFDIGLDGYAVDIARCREINAGNEVFYDALSIQLGAIQRLFTRMSDGAGDPEVARILKKIAHRSPETFHEALQLYWLMHYINGVDTYGRFDWNLDSFYRADIAAGRLDEERATELVAEFCIKNEMVESIQNMTIGGTDGAGRDFYCPLTRIMLKAVKELGYKGPNLCLRITRTMPDDVWELALDAIGTGIGLPALYNDKPYIDNLVRNGVPLELARGFCLGGCSQTLVPGMSNFMNDIGLYNAGKVIEMTMFGGFDHRTGEQTGLKTPDAAEFETFEDLYDAFNRQLDYTVDLEVSIKNKLIPYCAEREGYVMRTLFTRDCISTARNVNAGGARFNNIELEIMAITNAADHLIAVKKAVFEEKRYSMADVAAALLADYEGYEEMRQYFITKMPKFGNDIAEVDDLRAEITRRLYSRFNSSPAVLGGVFVPGEVVFVTHVSCGETTLATADGRRAFAPFADSVGSSQGRDVTGPTALMNSVLKVPVGDHLLTTAVLNIRFLPQIFAAASRKSVKELFDSFFERGGQQLQVNVCDVEALKEAQKNPDAHKSLVVRVGGYSDYFVRLSKALQDDIISRTAQAV